MGIFWDLIQQDAIEKQKVKSTSLEERVAELEKDQARQNKLVSFGITFLRFDDLDVKTNIKWVVNEILRKIKTHPQPRNAEPLQGGE